MKKLTLIAITLFVVACSGTPYPMSAQAFINSNQAAISSNKGATSTSFEVMEPFAEVEAYLRKKSKQCLNVNLQGDNGPMRWNSSEEYLGENHAAFLLHKDDPDVKFSERPGPGVIMLAAEIRSVTLNKSRVTLHYNKNDGLDQVVSAMKSWAKIRHTACPKW